MNRYLIIFFALVYTVQPAAAQPQKLTLANTLAYVYENNPALKASRSELRAAQEFYPQALAGWRPSLEAETGIFSTDIENSNFGSATGATTKDISVNLQQPLFRGGRTLAETAKARSLIMAARAEAFRAEQIIFFDTARVYMDVIRDRTLLNLRAADENILSEELKAAQERLKAGDLTVTDAKQAESRLARSHASRIRAESDFNSSIASFTQITGFTPSDAFYYPDVPLPIPESLDEILSLVEMQNPEFVAARFEYEAAKHNIDNVLRELFPQIFAYAAYNKQFDPQPGIIDTSQTETVGVRATLQLYQAGSIRSRVRQAKSTAAQRRYESEDMLAGLRAEATANWNGLQAAKAEIESRNAQITAAEMAREGVKEEARLGTRTVLDLLDSEQELLEARTALASARRDAIVFSFALAGSIGALRPEYFGVSEPAFNADEHLDAISRKIFSVDAGLDEDL